MGRKHAVGLAIAGALAAGGGLAAAWHPGPSLAAPAWSEAAWPHPLDAWPAGRAFACPPNRCGAEVRIALRPKIGFCNCATGVADDDEIDRVGDLVVLGPDYGPDGPGWPLRMGELAGRSRRYVVKEIGGGKRYALGLAVAAHCDVVVGTIDSERPIPPSVEKAALDFLAGEPVRGWAEKAVSGY